MLSWAVSCLKALVDELEHVLINDRVSMRSRKMTFQFPFLQKLMGYTLFKLSFEPPHDKTNKVSVRLAKTQISLGIRPVWSESSLFARRKFGSLATHWAHSEDSDQTGRMSRLIWVFARRTVTLLVFSWGGSFFPFSLCHGANLSETNKSDSKVSDTLSAWMAHERTNWNNLSKKHASFQNY